MGMGIPRSQRRIPAPMGSSNPSDKQLAKGPQRSQDARKTTVWPLGALRLTSRVGEHTCQHSIAGARLAGSRIELNIDRWPTEWPFIAFDRLVIARTPHHFLVSRGICIVVAGEAGRGGGSNRALTRLPRRDQPA